MWINENPSEASITRLDIIQGGNELSMQIWIPCNQGECDAGIQQGTISGDTATILWENDLAIRTVTLDLLEDDKLRIGIEGIFKNNRQFKPSVNIFIRQSS